MAARSVPSPWDRAQALAWVARYADPEHTIKYVTEALKAADSCEDPFQQVGSACWPLRALIELRRDTEAERVWRGLLLKAGTVEPMASRAEAWLLLWQAVFPAGSQARDAAWTAILSSCPPDSHWRASRLYRTVLAQAASIDQPAAATMCTTMPAGRTRDKAITDRKRGLSHGARDFFWTAG